MLGPLPHLARGPIAHRAALSREPRPEACAHEHHVRSASRRALCAREQCRRHRHTIRRRLASRFIRRLTCLRQVRSLHATSVAAFASNVPRAFRCRLPGGTRYAAAAVWRDAAAGDLAWRSSTSGLSAGPAAAEHVCLRRQDISAGRRRPDASHARDVWRAAQVRARATGWRRAAKPCARSHASCCF